jgi:hypothetical protein
MSRFTLWGERHTIAPNIPGQCPLVLLEKVGWRRDRAFGREVDTVMGREMWAFRAEERQ